MLLEIQGESLGDLYLGLGYPSSKRFATAPMRRFRLQEHGAEPHAWICSWCCFRGVIPGQYRVLRSGVALPVVEDIYVASGNRCRQMLAPVQDVLKRFQVTATVSRTGSRSIAHSVPNVDLAKERDRRRGATTQRGDREVVWRQGAPKSVLEHRRV